MADATVYKLRKALSDLVCCPAFNGEVFERDTESHKAWTNARIALQETEPPITVDHRHVRYEHDCDECVFLDTVKDDGGMAYDLYFCRQSGYPTVLARFGCSPENYKSGMASVGVDPELTAAATLAVKRGLLSPDHKTGRANDPTVGEAIA